MTLETYNADDVTDPILGNPTVSEESEMDVTSTEKVTSINDVGSLDEAREYAAKAGPRNEKNEASALGTVKALLNAATDSDLRACYFEFLAPKNSTKAITKEEQEKGMEVVKSRLAAFRESPVLTYDAVQYAIAIWKKQQLPQYADKFELEYQKQQKSKLEMSQFSFLEKGILEALQKGAEKDDCSEAVISQAMKGSSKERDVCLGAFLLAVKFNVLSLDNARQGFQQYIEREMKAGTDPLIQYKALDLVSIAYKILGNDDSVKAQLIRSGVLTQ